MNKIQSKSFNTLFKGLIILAIAINLVQANQIDTQLKTEVMRDRLSIIIGKEYSIKEISDIEIGLVNYPQWFASVHLIRLNSLTFNNMVEGHEALYPTNITHDRWMYSFKTSNFKSIKNCRKILKKWTKNKRLELTMSSQMMAICLVSLNNYTLDAQVWYDKCWRYFNGRICK